MPRPPRRPVNALDAAEAAFAAFKPKAAAAPPPPRAAVPAGRELVSIRIDNAVLEHFQEDGPGWQDRINDALRQLVEQRTGGAG